MTRAEQKQASLECLRAYMARREGSEAPISDVAKALRVTPLRAWMLAMAASHEGWLALSEKSVLYTP